jgi:hypothetical protein
LSAALQKLPVAGVPLPPALSAGLLTPPKRPTEGLPLPRPGTVSIHDARKVADDFLFLRTTGRSVRDFRRMFAFPRLDGVSWKDRLLIVRGEREGTLNVYDAALQKRLTLTVDLRQGYAMRRGREYPAAGLRLEDGTPIPPAYDEP